MPTLKWIRNDEVINHYIDISCEILEGIIALMRTTSMRNTTAARTRSSMEVV